MTRVRSKTRTPDNVSSKSPVNVRHGCDMLASKQISALDMRGPIAGGARLRTNAQLRTTRWEKRGRIEVTGLGPCEDGRAVHAEEARCAVRSVPAARADARADPVVDSRLAQSTVPCMTTNATVK